MTELYLGVSLKRYASSSVERFSVFSLIMPTYVSFHATQVGSHLLSTKVSRQSPRQATLLPLN